MQTLKRRAIKEQCHLTLHDVLDHHARLLGILLPPSMPADDTWLEAARGLREAFDEDRFSLAASFVYGVDDQHRLSDTAIARCGPAVVRAERL